VNVGTVIQARIGSTRLPGKVLKPLAGASMLRRIIDRAAKASRPDRLIVAVPYDSSNAPAPEDADSAGTDIVRGREDDVLARYVQVIERFGLDAVVRLTADNPFVEGEVIDDMVDEFLAGELDYLHNARGSGFPLGTTVEVADAGALLEAFAQSDRKSDHEHVTPYLYRSNREFRTGAFERDEPVEDVRLTVDTSEDYQLATWIYEKLSGEEAFGLEEILGLRARHPEKFEINSAVEQKTVGGTSKSS